jgi:hypothetical protein
MKAYRGGEGEALHILCLAQHWMEVGGKLHSVATLLPVKESQVHIG